MAVLGVKMKVPNAAAAYAILIMVLLVGQASLSMAVTCNAIELAPCYSAITNDTPPSTTCCSKLKEQRPCLCQYVKNPNYQRLVNSPNAKKVARACGVPFPSC